MALAQLICGHSIAVAEIKHNSIYMKVVIIISIPLFSDVRSDQKCLTQIAKRWLKIRIMVRFTKNSYRLLKRHHVLP